MEELHVYAKDVVAMHVRRRVSSLPSHVLTSVLLALTKQARMLSLLAFTMARIA